MRNARTPAVTGIAALLLSLGLFTAFRTPEAPPKPSLIMAVPVSPASTFSLDNISEDVLWLARCAYSETKRPQEQELVAWVIRNRVETGYRGQHTYEDVVLDAYQFSAFNPGTRTRRRYMSLTPQSQSLGWARALEIAHRVYHAPASERPFAQTTRHFYSEQSMRGGGQPNWARGRQPVRQTRYSIDPRRFRFYANIA